jgi:hypothetical protein
MPWITIVESESLSLVAPEEKTFNMPAVPAVGDMVRIGNLPESPVYVVTGVMWEVFPEMEMPDFDPGDVPTVTLYVAKASRSPALKQPPQLGVERSGAE